MGHLSFLLRGAAARALLLDAPQPESLTTKKTSDKFQAAMPEVARHDPEAFRGLVNQTVRGSLRQEAWERRKRCKETKRKPFTGTLWVGNPTRQSLASSRKRVLRPVGRPTGRSVDSECQGRAIEPRKLLIAGAFAVELAGAVSLPSTGLGPAILPGSESTA